MENKLIVLTEEAYHALSEKLDALIHAAGIDKSEQKEEWLTNEAVMKRLNISKSTLQTYRDKGIIPFSQIGRKLMYKKSEINQAIENFKVSSSHHSIKRR
jgi:predicted DNA-binding transcriptional regulator AlpA